jgi:hypothetical protein
MNHSTGIYMVQVQIRHYTAPFMVFGVMYITCKGPKLDILKRPSVTFANCQYDIIRQHM